MKTKPKLILLPGLLCDERIWSQQARDLSRYCQPRILDLRDSNSLDKMLEKIKAEGTDLYLAGFSMGGYVAQEFLMRHPESVKKVAMLSVSAIGYTSALKSKMVSLVERARGGVFESPFKEKLDLWLSSDSRKNASIVDTLLDMEAKAGCTVFLNQTQATLERRDLREHLKQHSLPALIVGGEDDKIVPVPLIRELANSLPGSKLEIIKNCGHFAPLEQPEILSNLMKLWLYG